MYNCIIIVLLYNMRTVYAVTVYAKITFKITVTLRRLELNYYCLTLFIYINCPLLDESKASWIRLLNLT